ncbi:hypothetical protein DER45DRAFT_608667 [Fusarium avenaceum]|nr:hypothetical protein DER45DRAFT_608667 [Fusarium avenaceum]
MPSLENIETPKPVDGLTKGFSRDAGAGFILGGLGGVIAFSHSTTTNDIVMGMEAKISISGARDEKKVLDICVTMELDT